MWVYVLYDCVENPDEWAFAGVERVYKNYDDAYARMKELYEECKAEYLDVSNDEDVRHTFIDGGEAVVVNSERGFHHTWTITHEEVV